MVPFKFKDAEETKIQDNRGVRLSQYFEENDERLDSESSTDFNIKRESEAMINARKTLALPELVEVASVDSSSRRQDEKHILGPKQTLKKNLKIPSSTMVSLTDF